MSTLDHFAHCLPAAPRPTSPQVYVRKRPYLDKFLAWASARFEVVIFTASQQVYAERLLALLDPEGRHIEHKLYRDSCLNLDGNYLKDLNVLGRDLSRTVLVDNSPHAFGYQVRTVAAVESWGRHAMPPGTRARARIARPRRTAHTRFAQGTVTPTLRTLVLRLPPPAARQWHPHRVMVRRPR